ncbi:MAG TPA: HTTM domain-containing protein, partial [Candidatus Peribacterales bacterium]|nr:HTTM domain-containing protein [Candidatus Peribacterales bacterium]
MIVARIDHWLTRLGPPHLIAILRILFGAYMLLYFGVHIPSVAILYSNAGLAIPYDLSLMLPNFPLLPYLQYFLTPPSPEISYLLYGLMLASLLSLTIGCRTRTSALASFLFYLYYNFLSFHNYSTSYNRLFLFFLFLFIFSGAGKTFSVEMWRKYGSPLAWEPVSVLIQRIIAIQITMTYLGVAWQKTWLPAWQGGEVLYYSFQGMWATPLAWFTVRLPIPMWVYDALVILVKVMEVSFPMGFWIKKLRWYAFALGIFFHVSVTLFLAAIWWFYAMIACYITFFDPEEVYERMRIWIPKIPSSPSSSPA